MIHVPYHSQEEFDPYGYHNNSALPVLTSMLDWHTPTWKYRSEPPGYTQPLLTRCIDLVLGSPALPDFLTPFDMAETLDQYDLPMRYTCSGMQAVRRELDAERPVVALVWYGGLPYRQNPHFTGAQYVVMVGYDRNSYIIHDTNWYGAGRQDLGLEMPRGMDKPKIN